MKKYVVYIEENLTLKVIELGQLVFKYNNQYKARLIYESNKSYKLRDWDWSIALDARIYNIVATFSDENVLNNILEIIKEEEEKQGPRFNFFYNVTEYIQNEFPEFCI